jgi:uncharacterized protein (TIGR00288 family)
VKADSRLNRAGPKASLFPKMVNEPRFGAVFSFLESGLRKSLRSGRMKVTTFTQERNLRRETQSFERAFDLKCPRSQLGFFCSIRTKRIELTMASSRLSAKNGPEETVSRLAVLIDGDNAPASVIEEILTKVARFGEATVKRIYGDFTASTSGKWKAVLQKHAIKPVQQFAYATGKNATDIALVIDAMDLLYTRNFDGFCLVSSDSDFTGLATRIREEGLKVLGFGAHKTPCAFQNACDEFIFIEALRRSKAETVSVAANANAAPAPAPKKPAPASEPARKFPKEIALDALEYSSDENGWAYLAVFGGYLNKLEPDFDPRAYGYKKLSDLVKGKVDLFTTEERQVPGQTSKNLYLRAK